MDEERKIEITETSESTHARGRIGGFVHNHPVISLALGAGVGGLFSLEVAAGALIGGTVALLATGARPHVPLLGRGREYLARFKKRTVHVHHDETEEGERPVTH